MVETHEKNECLSVERGASGSSVMRTRRHLTFSVAGYRLFQFSTEAEQQRERGREKRKTSRSRARERAREGGMTTGEKKRRISKGKRSRLSPTPHLGGDEPRCRLAEMGGGGLD